MDNDNLKHQLKMAQEAIYSLEQELAETNQGLLALTLELETRVDERTAELHMAQEELLKTNSELLQLTLELEDRVTERTEELGESEERFRTVANYTYDWEYWAGPDGNYIFVSPSCERVTGFRPDEFVNDPDLLYKIIHPDDRSLLETHRQDQLQNDPPDGMDFRIITRDGKERWINHISLPVFGNNGQWLGRRASNRDITDRKQAEREIRTLNAELEKRVIQRTAQLEVVNKDLEAFAYSVSHDLRAPLRHIVSFVELLKERTNSTFDDESLRYFNIVSDEATRMGVLIDDLLKFSRLGRTEIQKARVDFNLLVQEAIKEMEPEAGGRNVIWHISDLPSILCDRSMFRLVWINLISNALKYTRPREQAEITIGCMVNVNEENVFFIRDNGVGFDMRYADKLFGVFQRLHRADEFEGTGIGLANVKQIIHKHGGRVWAEGTLNNGAVFYFSLPDGD